MTKEQEEAISRLRKITNRQILYGNKFGITIEGFKELQEDLETVLNMLKEKDAEIEKYKQLYNKVLDDSVITAHDNMKKDKEIQFQKDINKQEKDRHKQAEKSLKGQIKTLKRDFKIVDQECSRLERQEAKQDKMIDLILEFLSERDLGYYTKEEGGEVLGIMRKYNKEDWKQYFERKLEKC